jgi:DNA (cytosine-5)-methyltransferase 1
MLGRSGLGSQSGLDGPFHLENRRLRAAELKRLFIFPDDFAFVGSRKSVQAQIGDAVLPLLARRVAEALAAAL